MQLRKDRQEIERKGCGMDAASRAIQGKLKKAPTIYRHFLQNLGEQ